MPNEINSTYMNLPVPVVGIDPGPQYAIDVNSCLTILDQHTHLSGSGVPITSAAININADLPFNNFNLTDIRAARFHLQTSPIPAAPPDLGELYVAGVDLYYNDAAGNQIRITQSGGVVGAPGNITGLTPPASASYVALNQTFVWQSAANTPANLDAASITLRNLVANSKGLTLNPPNAMGADYQITLPSLPSQPSFVTIDSSGNEGTVTIASVNQQISQAAPPGMIGAFGFLTTPTGWLLCDGASVSRTTYANLFAAIGLSYGNNGPPTNFNVPDLRGMFLRGVALTSGNDPDDSLRTPNNPGGQSGDNVGSQQSSAFASHHHSVRAKIQANGGAPTALLSTAGGGVMGDQGNNGQQGDVDSFGNQIVGDTGGSVETRPINVYVAYFIKI